MYIFVNQDFDANLKNQNNFHFSNKLRGLCHLTLSDFSSLQTDVLMKMWTIYGEDNLQSNYHLLTKWLKVYNH